MLTLEEVKKVLKEYPSNDRRAVKVIGGLLLQIWEHSTQLTAEHVKLREALRSMGAEVVAHREALSGSAPVAVEDEAPQPVPVVGATTPTVAGSDTMDDAALEAARMAKLAKMGVQAAAGNNAPPVPGPVTAAMPTTPPGAPPVDMSKATMQGDFRVATAFAPKAPPAAPAEATTAPEAAPAKKGKNK